MNASLHLHNISSDLWGLVASRNQYLSKDDKSMIGEAIDQDEHSTKHLESLESSMNAPKNTFENIHSDENEAGVTSQIEEKFVLSKTTVSSATLEELCISWALAPNSKEESPERDKWVNSFEKSIKELQVWPKILKKALGKPLCAEWRGRPMYSKSLGKNPSRVPQPWTRGAHSRITMFPFSLLARQLWKMQREILRRFGVELSHPVFGQEVLNFRIWYMEKVSLSSAKLPDSKQGTSCYSLWELYVGHRKALGKLAPWQARIPNKTKLSVRIIQEQIFVARNAINIIGTYYKSQNPTKWTWFFGGNDEGFHMLLEQIMAKAWGCTEQIYPKLDSTGTKFFPWATKVDVIEADFLQKLSLPAKVVPTNVFKNHIQNIGKEVAPIEN
ncbi:hypothetical protein O181_018727 [Austropuccinia psidii MF-1]|uniref:Uncharacterized protein n=1 Tax=Austropuccinia psidii MF-1 TaxID=1389203 RepID=A0A9Q3CA50_9BASI|nr:hypothetical protein [Austropuccinia psidii MF-1]